MSDPAAIPFQDLAAHHHALLPQLEQALGRVLRSAAFIQGAEVAAFEREAAQALGVAHAVAVSSGTDALLASLMALGIGGPEGRGDQQAQVVTTPFSFFASAGVIARVGATPVFADIDPDTHLMNDAAAAALIGPDTRAVLTVHLFGRVAPTAALTPACAAAGIPLLEDAAQAIGARGDGAGAGAEAAGRPVGTIGRAAALSFFPSKNLGALGDGGMVLTGDAALAERLRLLRKQGAAPKYHHTVVGGNFRLDELQAAALRVKLPHLPAWTARRRQLAESYRARLSSLAARAPLALPPEDPGCVWNQFVVRVGDGRRDALAGHLHARGIATAIYYPEPLHLQPCFAALGYRAGQLPHAERACQQVLALPIYPELPDDAVARIADAIHGFFA